MHRSITLLLLLCLCIQQQAAAFSKQRDSLETALQRTTTGQERLKTLRNLADLCSDTPEEKKYLTLLCAEAEKQKDREAMNEARKDLALIYLVDKSPDSARLCIEEISNGLSDPQERDRWVSYLNMRLFELELVMGNKNKTVESTLEIIKSNQNNNVYTQIEYAFNIGVSLEIRQKYSDAIPYLETALQHIRTLSPDALFLYLRATVRRLSTCYIATKQGAKSIAILEELMQIQDLYYEHELKKERPFYPINSERIRNYAALFMNARFMSSEQVATHLLGLKRSYSANLSLPNRYSYFLALNNVYLSTGKYPEAIRANDSLIQYAREVAPYNLPSLYNINSILYETIKDYQSALLFARLSSRLKDSLSTSEANEQLNKLQVEYDLNQLNYEKSILEAKSKKIQLIFSISALCLVILICAYLYHSLKKEKRMKAKMAVLREQAVESERLKSAFVRSICHEIRTPLNAIVGFSGLAFDETLDAESKQLFQQEINKNTNLLTSLVNSMLEVSILDISQDKLPCHPTDVTAVCELSMEYLLHHPKEGIEYRAETSGQELIVSTNDRYLGMVLENLLDNANKFTETGLITLCCTVDQVTKSLVLSVSDTGCGIPPDKRNEVFERFTKLDEYKQGNGLGLYLCKLIISRMSGEIYIDPDYTGGTRVVVKLPLE